MAANATGPAPTTTVPAHEAASAATAAAIASGTTVDVETTENAVTTVPAPEAVNETAEGDGVAAKMATAAATAKPTSQPAAHG